MAKPAGSMAVLSSPTLHAPSASAPTNHAYPLIYFCVKGPFAFAAGRKYATELYLMLLRYYQEISEVERVTLTANPPPL